MVTLTIDNEITLTGATIAVEGEIKQRLTLPNPKYIEAEKQGRSTWNIPLVIRCYEKEEDKLYIPRGFTRQLCGILKSHGVQFNLIDRRRDLQEVDFSFKGTLRDYQTETVQAVLDHEFGVLEAPTGSGKTTIALAVIATRRQPTLVIVHTRELQGQWIERVQSFLGIDQEEIGIIGGGRVKIGDRITVAIVNSVYPIAHEIKERFGFIVVDECHRCPSRTFTEAVGAFDSRFMLGLSATPWRRDGLTKLIYWHLGDRVHKVERDGLVEAGAILRADVTWRPTAFRTRFNPSEEYSRMLSELTEDRDRNGLIVGDVIEEARTAGGVCLVLSDRKGHIEALGGMIQRAGVPTEVLHGGMGAKVRQDVVEKLKNGRVRVLCATGQLIGEGFDCPALASLVIATPIKFDGRLLQYLGRVLRPAQGKEKARVVDYEDSNVGVLANAARARRRVYENHLT